MGRILQIIAGIVVAGLLVGAAPPPNERAQAEQAQAARDLTNAVEALSRNVAEQSKAGQPSELERPCEPGQDSRGSDLCAQWKAADAAREAARWTFWSMLVGVAGVLGLVLNLRQGRAALAKAREANEIARESAERQLRAYVYVSRVEVRDIKPGYRAIHKILLTNAGQTPAYDLKLRGFSQIHTDAPEKHVLRFGHCKISRLRVIPPSAPTGVFFPDDGPWSADECGMLNAGQTHLTFAAIYSYRDVFGKRRRGTCFAKYVLGTAPDKDGSMPLMACDRGNRSN